MLRILVAKGCREPEEGRGHLPKRETRPEKPCVRLHEMEPKMVRETSEGLESFVTLTYLSNARISLIFLALDESRLEKAISTTLTNFFMHIYFTTRFSLYNFEVI